MKYDKALRFYGRKAFYTLSPIIHRTRFASISCEFVYSALEHYPVLLLTDYCYRQILPILDELHLEYDDITPTSFGYETPRPKRLVILYEERKGGIHFSYRETTPLYTQHHSGRYQDYKVTGTVPKEVEEAGKEAVEAYATEFVAKELARQIERHSFWEEIEANPNCPLEVEHDGTILKGCIASTQDTVLTVRLDEPYQGSQICIYGYASAMSGHYIHNKDGTITDYTLKQAKDILVSIYNKEKHNQENQGTLDLVKTLNTPPTHKENGNA